MEEIAAEVKRGTSVEVDRDDVFTRTEELESSTSGRSIEQRKVNICPMNIIIIHHHHPHQNHHHNRDA